MLNTPKSDATIHILLQKSRLIRWANIFFQSSIIQILWAHVICSLSFLFVAYRSGISGLLLMSPLVCRRCFSAYPDLKECLFELLLLSCNLKQSDLWCNQNIFTQRTADRYFQTFGPFSPHLRDGCVVFPADNLFLKYSYQRFLALTTRHLTSSWTGVLSKVPGNCVCFTF